MMVIEKIGVLGAGIMGSGIAQVASQCGYQVVIRDTDIKYVDRGLKVIRDSLHRKKERGKLSAEDVNKVLDRLTGTVSLQEVAQESHLIIEAVPENLELKRQLFAELDRICPQNTILATNTSSLSITAIAAATGRPERVIGMHFSNPVPLMMGVELIKGRDTSEDTLEAAKVVVARMGKDYFTAADFAGFAGNRLLPLYVNEAFYILWEGIASAEDIDKMAKPNAGQPMGPLELADLIGLDTLLSILENLHREINEKYRPCPLLKQMVAAGHFGRKTGRGVYKYT
jgi:3-hydroxybutyryl-CoA dehydrogenase